MAKISGKDWFKIQGWMVTQLGLTGSELVAFALVNSFSKTEEGLYKGGLSYLAEWLKSSKRTALRNLQYLEGKGLIEAVRGNGPAGPFCHYRVVSSASIGSGKNVTTPVTSASLPHCHPCHHHKGEQKGEQKGEHNLPKEEKKSTKKESFTDSIVRQWQNKQ